VGYVRIRIAFGGISLGLGVFAAFAAYLLSNNIIVLRDAPAGVSTLFLWILIFVSVVQILAGLLHVTASEQ
jgi:hypothetical protein